MTSDQPGLTDAQRSLAHDPGDVTGWEVAEHGHPRLLDVVRNARPTALLGVSGQPGTFDEAICRAMTRNAARPAIMPLSNPTSRAEATPQQILDWTDGTAIVGTGSPFAPVERDGATIAINQASNAFAFPGIGLGALAVRARRISDGTFMAAARAIALASPARRDAEAPLLPGVAEIAAINRLVATAVARRLVADGDAEPHTEAEIEGRLEALRWEPCYR